MALRTLETREVAPWSSVTPRKCRFGRSTARRERGQLLLLGLASIYEGLVAVLSLGFYTTDIRSYLLFDYFED
jgi:hypothetical protein